MIVIDTSLTPVQEIEVAQGLAEVIKDNPEVEGITVYTNVYAIEAESVWACET